MKTSISLPQLPHSPGVYLMRDGAGSIIYIGKARDLKKRVSSYFVGSLQQRKDVSLKIHALLETVRHVDYVTTSSERGALVLERKLISRHQPAFNSMWKDDKSYPFVALTMGEDFPRLFLTRQKKKDKGTLLFGPYPNVSRVRNLLRWAWRKKLFPLRPCHFDIKEKIPLPYEKVKSCLYLHTGECSAPCLGKISSVQYKKVAKRAQLFFEGKTQKLLKQWETEMRQFSRRKEYEKAGEVKERIETVNHIEERVTFRELSEDTLPSRVRESRAIQDLTRALNLRTPPQVIECFDISHFQGDNIVASMVQFANGRANKSQYRKFIIRTVSGSDDFKSMGEVVERRYRRLLQEKKMLPDLILIDGGKGQLSSAHDSLRKLKLSKIPIAALAKREEEIFIPGQSGSIQLKMDSPGLLLLRQIRDEAHRFAITFHRKRRAKSALGT